MVRCTYCVNMLHYTAIYFKDDPEQNTYPIW